MEVNVKLSIIISIINSKWLLLVDITGAIRKTDFSNKYQLVIFDFMIYNPIYLELRSWVE